MSRRGSRPSFRDEAFVVRTHKLGEADLVIVLLTRNHGTVRGVAKGVRKPNSRFGSRLDRFCRVDVQLYPGRDLASITDAATVATYAPQIVADVDRYYAATAALEVAQVTAGEDGGEIFDLLDAALADIAGVRPAAHPLPPRPLVDRFVLHALTVAGWAPSLVDCAQCGKRGPHRAFHPLAGGAVCTVCRPPGSLTPPPAAVRALWWLAHGRDEELSRLAESGDGADILGTAHDLLVAHVRQQVERPFSAYAAV